MTTKQCGETNCTGRSLWVCVGGRGWMCWVCLIVQKGGIKETKQSSSVCFIPVLPSPTPFASLFRRLSQAL